MEVDGILIKKATKYTPQNADALRTLAKQIGKNYQDLTNAEVEEMFSSPIHNIFFAHDIKTNKIVGMILVLIYRIPYVRKAYLDDLVIDTAYRKRGIASQLMQEALQYAEKNGAAYVDFTSRPFRGAGNNLYEKFGFKKRETNVYRIAFHYGED